MPVILILSIVLPLAVLFGLCTLLVVEALFGDGPGEEASTGVGRLPGPARRARRRLGKWGEAEDGADSAWRVPDGFERRGAGSFSGRGNGGQGQMVC